MNKVDALIIVNLILNIFIFIGLGFAIFLLNKKIVEDNQRAKTLADGLAKLDKHFKIGEQLLAKKLTENEVRIKQTQVKQTDLIANQIDTIKEELDVVLNEVKNLSKYEDLK